MPSSDALSSTRTSPSGVISNTRGTSGTSPSSRRRPTTPPREAVAATVRVRRLEWREAWALLARPRDAWSAVWWIGAGLFLIWVNLAVGMMDVENETVFVDRTKEQIQERSRVRPGA